MTSHFSSVLDEPSERPIILPLFGGSEKPIEEMSAEEHERAAEQIFAKAREAAFSRGLPIIISKNGCTVKEYADGRTEPVD